METNHYGKWIDSEIPTTGVISLNSVNSQILSDETINGIDLDYDEALQEFINDYEGDKESENYDEALQYFNDFYESQDATVLIGKWIKDNEGKYTPDTESDYSAIVRESVIQVVHSKTTSRAALCSPCYPGQADLDTKGDYLAFTLPEDMLKLDY